MGVDEGEYVGHRSFWWVLTYVVTVGGGVASGVGGLLMGGDVEALALAVVLLLAGVWVWFHDRRAPRRVRAAGEGVSVCNPAHERAVAWEEVRRVRTAGGHGAPAYDTHLDLVDGALVPLPRRLRAGTVERWREKRDGARPHSVLPDTWRVTEQGFSWPGIVSAGVISFVVQLAFREFGALGVAAVAVGATLSLSVFWYVNPLRMQQRMVRADETQLRYGRGGRRRLLWADVATVRTQDAYQETPVVEQHDGKIVPLMGPPLSLVQLWFESSSRRQPRQETEA